MFTRVLHLITRISMESPSASANADNRQATTTISANNRFIILVSSFIFCFGAIAPIIGGKQTPLLQYTFF